MPPHEAVALLVNAILAACLFGGVLRLAQGLVRTWRAGRNAEEALQRADLLTREGKVDEALAAVHRLPGSVATVIVAGFGAAGEIAAESAMEDAARQERLTLLEDVRVLDALGGLALLVPLAGVAFAALAGGAPAAPDEWDRSLAVVAAGLATAILATIARFWLLARIRRLAVDMEKGAAVVYNTAR